MATKLFNHPAGGYLLETSTGNYRFNDLAAIRTQETGEGMTEAYPDIQVSGMLENTYNNTPDRLAIDEIDVLQSFVQHLIETAD